MHQLYILNIIAAVSIGAFLTGIGLFAGWLIWGVL